MAVEARTRPQVAAMLQTWRLLHAAPQPYTRERWIHHYNWHRPRQGIKGLTPASRLTQSRNNLLTLHS